MMLSTFAGRRVNPLKMRVADICIEDIAHALALTNRFCGHTKEPISVAQHSWYVSKLAVQFEDSRHIAPPGEWRDQHLRAVGRQGLLHDGAEAYLGDVTKWVKESAEMAGFRAAEDRAQEVCYEAMGVPLYTYAKSANLKHPSVEAADKLMVRFEGLWSYGKSMPLFAEKADYPVPTEAEIALVGNWHPWSWQHAEAMFLARYEELT